jgi:hypothetical protein
MQAVRQDRSCPRGPAGGNARAHAARTRKGTPPIVWVITRLTTLRAVHGRRALRARAASLARSGDAALPGELALLLLYGVPANAGGYCDKTNDAMIGNTLTSSSQSDMYKWQDYLSSRRRGLSGRPCLTQCCLRGDHRRQ